MPKKRGMGCIYPRGSIFWIKYSKNGKVYHESSRSSMESEAKTLLKRRLGEMAEGRFIGPAAERVTLKELLDDVVTDYRINAKRSIKKVEQSVSHLTGYFGNIRAEAVGTDKIKALIARLQAQGAANAQVNRVLATL